MQIAEPAILARVHAARVTPGDEIRVRLVAADVAARTVAVPTGELAVGRRPCERPDYAGSRR